MIVGTLLVSRGVGGGHGCVATQLVTAGAGGVGGGVDPAAIPLIVASPNAIVLDDPSTIAASVTVVLLDDVTKVSPGAGLLVVVVPPSVRLDASRADEEDTELVAVVSPMMIVFEVPSEIVPGGVVACDVVVRDVAVRVVVGAVVVVVVVATECVSVVVATEREVVVDVGLVAAPDPATTSEVAGAAVVAVVDAADLVAAPDPATTSEAAGDAVVALAVVLDAAGCRVALPAPATTSAAGGSDTPRIPSASTIQRRT